MKANGITKKLTQPQEALITVDGYAIRAFAWTQHDPNNLATARLDIVYDLTTTGPDGAVTTSPLPGHRGIRLSVYDSGDAKHLTRWLEASGDPEDLFDWNYHDIERLVEADIAERRTGERT